MLSAKDLAKLYAANNNKVMVGYHIVRGFPLPPAADKTARIEAVAGIGGISVRELLLLNGED